jgi:hypothetical protein
MEDVDPRWLDDAFWDTAFDQRDPMKEKYLHEFRRGLMEGRESDLRWARLAIYALTDSARVSVVNRLLQLAARYPRAEFVESLMFYLQEKDVLSHIYTVLQKLPHDQQSRFVQHLGLIRNRLDAQGDADFVGTCDSIIGSAKDAGIGRI